MKEGIPESGKRLVYRRSADEASPSAAGDDLVKELRSWQAILRCGDRSVGKLQHPQVLEHDERLQCDTARHLHQLGVECRVYHLAYDRWVPLLLPGPTSLCYQMDDAFRSSHYRIDLFGTLKGSYLAAPFTYHMSGAHVCAQLSAHQQTVTSPPPSLHPPPPSS